MQARWNGLVGADAKKIRERIVHFNPPRYRPQAFGLPGASGRIAKIVDEFLSKP